VAIVAVPLATQLEQQRITETNKQLEAIKEAIIGFALANGRFPCAARLADNGSESLKNTGPSIGDCYANAGYVPAVTLGLSSIDSNGFAIDGWGLSQNRIRYAVANLSSTANAPSAAVCPTTVANVLTRTDGMKLATMTCLANTTLPALNMLTVASTSVTNAAQGCAPANLTTKAPFVLISLGKNAATGGIDADELFNVGGGPTFVSHTPTQKGSCAGEFDDLLTWPSINTIFARMVQVGRLP